MKYLFHPFLYLYAFLTGGTVIVLRDRWGETYHTAMHKNLFGECEAHVYWVTHTGHVICHPDGNATGTSSYIRQWKKL